MNGNFIVVEVPEKSKAFIGNDIPQKIMMGTITWFFHLVSDMAGSSSTAGTTGGTGIPGPILSLAKEISAIPLFKNLKVDGDMSLSVFLSKLFNGTLMMQHDENGQIIEDTVIKFDLRGELGAGEELSRQAVPVAANECIVRSFYFIRRFAMAMKEANVHSIADLKKIEWNNVKPTDNPTIARMLTISTGVFTALDVSEAIATQRFWVSINYAGIGQFAVAIDLDVSWGLKARNVKKVREMYEDLKRQTFRKTDADIYKRIGYDMGVQMDKLGLSLEQTEILYNVEYYKTLNDIEVTTNIPVRGKAVKDLKREWLQEWSQFISEGFESFTQVPGAEMHWYSMEELQQRIAENNPKEPWYRLILLEAMLFEPYYPLSTEQDKHGNDMPCKKYKSLSSNEGKGDRFLNEQFTGKYCKQGYVDGLRKSYNKRMNELNEVLKSALKSVSITALIAIAVVATAGAFSGPIAVALVGSNFAGLSGAALTNACLAYLGGGAVAAGGGGMLGGTVVIVGGGSMLGIGAGATIGGTVYFVGLMGKKNTIMQSAKLLTAVREIFLNDEHDIEFSNSVYEQYVHNITDIEKGLVDLRLKRDVAKGKEKKALEKTIKKAEESVEAMKVARKSMLKFNSSFAEGMKAEQ